MENKQPGDDLFDRLSVSVLLTVLQNTWGFSFQHRVKSVQYLGKKGRKRLWKQNTITLMLFFWAQNAAVQEKQGLNC